MPLDRAACGALGQSQAAALGGDRAALHAVGGGYVDVDLGGAVLELLVGIS